MIMRPISVAISALVLVSISRGQQIVMGDYPVPTANSRPNGTSAIHFKVPANAPAGTHVVIGDDRYERVIAKKGFTVE